MTVVADSRLVRALFGNDNRLSLGVQPVLPVVRGVDGPREVEKRLTHGVTN